MGLLPASTPTEMEIMSLNLLTDNETDPVIWRGPVIAGAVTQFWTDVIWGDLDVMFIDMPPGTGDVPLTIFQSIPVDGIIIVTSPQELVSMIVEKAMKMAQMIISLIILFCRTIRMTVLQMQRILFLMKKKKRGPHLIIPATVLQ